MKPIILASTSPRRKEILEKLELQFVTEASPFKEDMTLDLVPEDLAKHLAEGKAKAVAEKHKNAIIIGADTFIVFGGKILGKPSSEEKARKMLKMLSGKQHSVFTGFAIIDTDTKKMDSRVVETKVYFKKLTDQDIDDYIASGEPIDKAGSYAIQGLGAKLIKKIEGDYFNVMGLPLNALIKSLKDFGIE